MIEMGAGVLKKRKEYIGSVVRDKMEKTVIVSVQKTVQNKQFKKYVKRTTMLMAHDDQNACHVGDTVKLIETRPLSAKTKWKVLEILKEAKRKVEEK